MSAKPTVFVGSSTEKGLEIANVLQELLEYDADVRVWNQGVFKLGQTTGQSLSEQLDTADFAVLVFTADDVTISRQKQQASPRDNVLFEFGLFAGRLGFDRCYVVYDKAANLKIPSDLLGLTPATYRVHASGDVRASLGPMANKIRERLTLGPRRKFSSSDLQAQAARREFSDQVSGHWWECLYPPRRRGDTVLSFVAIARDDATNSVRITGKGFDNSSKPVTSWHSGASCIKLDEGKVFYYWRGFHYSRANEPFEGIGEITFGSSREKANAEGVFSNTNVTDLKSTTRIAFTLVRCTEPEVRIMLGDDETRKSSVLKKKLLTTCQRLDAASATKARTAVARRRGTSRKQ